MKKLIRLSVIALLFALPLLESCNKCQGCYFVEEIDGNKTESYIGEFCGDEITEKESEEYIPPAGKAYNECR